MAAMSRRELNELRWGPRSVARQRVKVTVARHPVHVAPLNHAGCAS